MKHYKIIPKHVEERKCVAKVTCDLCHNDIRDLTYEKAEVEIKADFGERYPEGSYGTKEEVDICQDCWKDKVRPAIEALGVKFHEEEYSF